MAGSKQVLPSYTETNHLIDFQKYLNENPARTVFDAIDGTPSVEQIVLQRTNDLDGSFAVWWQNYTTEQKIHFLKNNLQALSNLSDKAAIAIIHEFKKELRAFTNSDACKHPFRSCLEALLECRSLRNPYPKASWRYNDFQALNITHQNLAKALVYTYILVFERDFSNQQNDKILLQKNQQRLLEVARAMPGHGNQQMFWAGAVITITSIATILGLIALCVNAPALGLVTSDLALGIMITSLVLSIIGIIFGPTIMAIGSDTNEVDHMRHVANSANQNTCIRSTSAYEKIRTHLAQTAQVNFKDRTQFDHLAELVRTTLLGANATMPAQAQGQTLQFVTDPTHTSLFAQHQVNAYDTSRQLPANLQGQNTGTYADLLYAKQSPTVDVTPFVPPNLGTGGSNL